MDVLCHARKSLLVSNEKFSMKREWKIFDVTLGAYDDANICELVGTFTVNKISEKYNKLQRFSKNTINFNHNLKRKG